jgi:hypothetical protein
MKKYFFIYLFYCFYNFSAQILTTKQENQINLLLASKFPETKLNSNSFNNGAASFQYIGKDIFYNLNGFHYLFKLSGDSLIRIDHSNFHNCDNNRFLFNFNKEIYCLGGYGFFVTNNILKKFNVESKEWIFVECKGEIPPFISGPAFISGQYLYSFWNVKSGNNVTAETKEQSGYRLNLNTFLWEKIGFFYPKTAEINSTYVYGSILYTRDYVFIILGLQSLIIAPKTNSYILLNNEAFCLSPYSQLVRIDSNNIFYLFKEQTKQLNLDQYWKNNIKLANKITWEKPNFYSLNQFSPIYLAILSLILVSFVFIWFHNHVFFKKQRTQISSDLSAHETTSDAIKPAVTLENKDDLSPAPLKRVKKLSPDLIIALKNIKKENSATLSCDEFDAFFNINFLTGNSRKLRRFRVLKSLPSNLFLRDKCTKDKRKFNYSINLSLLSQLV